MAAAKTKPAKAPAKKATAKRTGGRSDTMSRDVVCQRFALAYMRYGNAVRAFREAVPNSQANDGTARKEAFTILHDERTQKCIDELRTRAATRAEATLAEWISNELRIARFDPARMFDEDGNLLALSDMDPDTRFAIQSIDVDEEKVEVHKAGADTEIVKRTRVRKIKFHSKDGAQERLGKHLGAYQKDNQQKSETYEELLKALHGQPDAG
jgi:phage terminase small subunit